MARDTDSLGILATAASVVTSIVGVALGISLTSPRRREVEAGRLARLTVIAFVLLGVGLLCVVFATLAPVYADCGPLSLGFGFGLGLGTYSLLLGMLHLNR